MSIQTLNDIFFAIAARDQARCILRRTETGWHPISARDFAVKVSAVAQALQSWRIGLGDRVAILSENRHEWVVADFACMLLGAVVVPIYTTLTPEQTAYILRDSEARAIFVSSQKHLEKVLSIQQNTGVEKVAVMDDVADAHAVKMSALIQHPSDPQLETPAAAHCPTSSPPSSIPRAQPEPRRE